MVGNVVVRSRRDVYDKNGEEVRTQLARGDDAGATSSETKLSLWQLLAVQATGDKERRELLAGYAAVANSVGGEGTSLARNLEIGRTIDMVAFLQTKSIRRASLDDAAVRPARVVLQRLQLARRMAAPHAAKFVRWEFIKAGMIHGMHRDGVLYDDQGSGSAINIPLRMTGDINRISPLTSAQQDIRSAPVGKGPLDARREQQFQQWYQERATLLFSEDSMREVNQLFVELSQKGGAITRPVYFAMMLIFCKFMLVHLSDVEIHELIAADFAVDCAEFARVVGKLTSPDARRRTSMFESLPEDIRASVGSILARKADEATHLRRQSSTVSHQPSLTSSDQEIDVDTAYAVADSMEVLHRHAFQRFVASLAFIWMESSSPFEFSQFVHALRSMWIPRLEYFDLDFVARFVASRDYLPSDTSLIPNVEGALASDDVIGIHCKYEIIRSLCIRFPMFTAGKNDVLRRAKQQVSLISSFLQKAGGLERRASRIKRANVGCGSFVFGIGVASEQQRTEDTLDDAAPPPQFVLGQPRDGLGCVAHVVHLDDACEVSHSCVFDDPGGASGGVGVSIPVVETQFGSPLRADMHNVPRFVGLKVPFKQRTASMAPTIRSAQYLSFKPHTDSQDVEHAKFGSRLLSRSHSVASSNRLPDIVRHVYHKQNIGHRSSSEMRGGVQSHSSEWLDESLRQECRAVYGRPGTLAPVHSPLSLSPNQAAPTLRYDLGTSDYKQQLTRVAYVHRTHDF